MVADYLNLFWQIIRTPFEHTALIWGIVPLYFALALNELTSTKASFRTAIQTGFSFIWAGAQWLYPYFHAHTPDGPRLEVGIMLPVNVAVTLLGIAFGVVALCSGIFKHFPKYCRF